MSNHLDIVVKLAPSRIDSLSPSKVAQHWTCLFKGTLLFQRWLSGDRFDQVQSHTVSDEIEEYRHRLSSLSWFMTHKDVLMPRVHGCTGAVTHKDVLMPRVHGCTGAAKCLNEPIARQANKEDGSTGHFWDKFLLLQNLHT